MANVVPEIIIITLFIGSAIGIYFISSILTDWSKSTENKDEYGWIIRISLNIIGYGTIFVPGYFVYKYIRKIKYIEKSGSGCFPSSIRVCFGARDVEPDRCSLSDKRNTLGGTHSRSAFHDGVTLLFCFLGLQTSYLLWGILQEKVMTQKYTNSSGSEVHFTDSQFLVFVNRVLAFAAAGLYVLCTRQSQHDAPFYKYVYCSFSNIMSSWCQYEALKYVSFPTQVLAKASKVIPVMIMGKIVSRNKYEVHEYITATFVSLGMMLFMLEAADNEKVSAATTFSGVVLLATYVGFDSFTSNWQGALFDRYGMSSVQMMFGVNAFSCLFTAMSLVERGDLVASFDFMLRFPEFTVDCLLLSVFSAAGQLLIFYTIAMFGPVTFVIIMTVRQGLAILLSCLVYGHRLSILAILGIIIVFSSLFLRVYLKRRRRPRDDVLKI